MYSFLCIPQVLLSMVPRNSNNSEIYRFLYAPYVLFNMAPRNRTRVDCPQDRTVALKGLSERPAPTLIYARRGWADFGDLRRNALVTSWSR